MRRGLLLNEGTSAEKIQNSFVSFRMGYVTGMAT